MACTTFLHAAFSTSSVRVVMYGLHTIVCVRVEPHAMICDHCIHRHKVCHLGWLTCWALVQSSCMMLCWAGVGIAVWFSEGKRCLTWPGSANALHCTVYKIRYSHKRFPT